VYRLTKSFPYLLNRVGVRMGELFSQRIKSFGVTLPMYRVLASLWELSEQRLNDLSAMTTIEISTLSRLIGTMERKGLVSRRRLEDNARTVAISLTGKGRTLAEKLMPIAVHFEEVAVSRLDPKEVTNITKVLAEVYESLNNIEAEINATQSAKTPRRQPKRQAP
jgi:DNA-binding MarR family transcriptional regulator